MAEGVWRSPTFLGVYGDPYLRATPYEFGGNPQALVAMLSSLPQLLSAPSESNVGELSISFPRTPAQEVFVREKLVAQLQVCRAWVEKGIKVADAKQLQAFLSEWKVFLTQLPLHEAVLVPGGYVGNTTSHTMIYVIEKTSEDLYSFTICNKGPGAEMYHATRASHSGDKVRVEPFVQIAHIPSSRFLDMAFWSLLFSLWMRKPPSEYHRVETIYDVLLPWLAGDKLLPLAVAESELQRIPAVMHSAMKQARSSQRSNLGYCKSVIEAMRYLCITKGGFTPTAVKFSVLYQLRYRLFQQLERNLEVARDPAKAIADDAIEKATRALESAPLVDPIQGPQSLATIPSNSVVGVYFAKAGNTDCKKLTNTLSLLTEKLWGESKTFVVIVVSVDQEQSEFAKLVTDLPTNNWLLVPFEEVETRKALVDAFRLRTIPSLILRDVQGRILTPKGREVIESDPSGAFFPWNSGNFQLPVDELSYSERLCVEMAVKQIALKTLRHHEANDLNTVELDHVNRKIARVDSLLQEIALVTETSGKGTRTSQSSVFFEQLPFACHGNMNLLQADGREDQYAGNAADIHVPVLGSFLDVPERDRKSVV